MVDSETNNAGPKPSVRRLQMNSRTMFPARTQAEMDQILSVFQQQTGFVTEQERGLRRVFREDVDAVRQRGSEVFIGRLPKDVLESELFGLCQPFGSVLEVRLMLNLENHLLNRGFAFVVFSRTEEACGAVRALDRYEIRPGMRIGVKKSVDNCRLFVGNLPRDKTKEEFDEQIRRHPACCHTMREVIMYPAVQDRTKNRGYAFVEFISHKEAAIARRQLMSEKVQLWGKEICVDWAQPEGEVEQDVMEKVRILYVRNLNMETTEDSLRSLVASVLPEGRMIEKVKKLKDFGFIHFQNREDAQYALDKLDGCNLDGSIIEIVWAKPASARVRTLQQTQRPISLHPLHVNECLTFPVSRNQSGISQFSQNYLQTMNHQWQIPNRFRPVVHLHQRHFRNAAGTRTRLSKPHGGQGSVIYGIPVDSHGYPANQQYTNQNFYPSYYPTTYYNPVVYHGAPSTPPMLVNEIYQTNYNGRDLHEQLSQMSLHIGEPVYYPCDPSHTPRSGSENEFQSNTSSG